LISKGLRPKIFFGHGIFILTPTHRQFQGQPLEIKALPRKLLPCSPPTHGKAENGKILIFNKNPDRPLATNKHPRMYNQQQNNIKKIFRSVLLTTIIESAISNANRNVAT
jgi:hypothetical protein